NFAFLVRITAPTVPPNTAPSTLSFTVTATSSSTGLSSMANVSVTVNPSADTVTITSATYKTSKASLTVNVTDATPGVTLTCTLNTINPATGQPWTGTMGPTNFRRLQDPIPSSSPA